jgi:hypothetical protein
MVVTPSVYFSKEMRHKHILIVLFNIRVINILPYIQKFRESKDELNQYNIHWTLSEKSEQISGSKGPKNLEDRHLSNTLLANLKMFIIMYQGRRNVLAWMDHWYTHPDTIPLEKNITMVLYVGSTPDYQYLQCRNKCDQQS